MAYSVRNMIESLVAFDTVSRHSNMEMIQFVQGYLSGHGIESHLVFNDDKSKANLYATVGPNVPGGVVLSGHTDVVPVDGQDWTTDPFSVTERDGRLYGRGTCDMKGFIAIALALVPDMLEANLQKPVHFAFSYDEEVGCAGAGPMIREMAEVLPKPRAVIVGEPTNMDIVNAHKGVNVFRTSVRGREAHSSQMHRGVSAVMTAARLITRLEDIMEDLKAKADPDNDFTPPYTTVHAGMVQGGTAMNIISKDCNFVWDVRNTPWDDPQEILARLNAYSAELLAGMQRIAPDTSIVIEQLAAAPALAPEEGSEAERLCCDLTGRNATGAVPYATEGGLFQASGFSTVICGPGSIDQAHQPDEFIEIEQLEAGEAFLRKLVGHLAA